MKKKVDIEYVEEIPCEVKNHDKKSVVRFYQQNLRQEIDKYVGNNTMTDSRKGYANALEINIKIAPFVLGWLKKPEDEDEYRVITGRMTIEELNKKRGTNKLLSKKTEKPTEAKKAAPKAAPKNKKKG